MIKILLLLLALFLFSCQNRTTFTPITPSSKIIVYQGCDWLGRPQYTNYYCNSYATNGSNCIYFTSMELDNNSQYVYGKSLTVCGTYTIEELK